MASTAFALDGQDELRMDCELAEAMGDCGLAEAFPIESRSGSGSQHGTQRPLPTVAIANSKDEDSDDDDGVIPSPSAVQRIERHREQRPRDGDRGAVADIVDRIFRNVYSRIEATEVLAGLSQLRVVHASARPGRVPHGAVRKERRGKPHLARPTTTEQPHKEALLTGVHTGAAGRYGNGLPYIQ
jgi:hypothetical protein